MDAAPADGNPRAGMRARSRSKNRILSRLAAAFLLLYRSTLGRSAICLFGLALVAAASFAIASDSTPILIGHVVKVVDGDTIDVQLSSGPIPVRLYAIDAPERGQLHGKEATAALSAWVLSKQVEIEPFQQDRYDRMVGIVRAGTIDVNAAMVRSGDAWAYRRYMKKADRQARQSQQDVLALSVVLHVIENCGGAHISVRPLFVTDWVMTNLPAARVELELARLRGKG